MSVGLGLDAGARMVGYKMSFSYTMAIGVNQGGADRESRRVINRIAAMNVCGYIPGVSLIVGIARIIFSQVVSWFTVSQQDNTDDQLKNRKAFQEAQVFRGVLECCSVFAPLIMISDLALSFIFKDRVES